ncbi:MAG: DcaP family trimeric outer membrane transporter, partial [Vicinamibacteria bacterium]
VFFRNVQVRFMPLQGETSVTIAVERPGASADQGPYADRIELENIDARFPAPDISGNIRRMGEWGHVQVSGIYRRIQWDDLLDDRFDLSGSANGWGLHVSGNYKIEKDTVKASVVFGSGIQNYMNDAPVDVGIQNNFSNPTTPILGKALPLTGISAFYDRTWNDKWTSTFGYSMLDIDNSDGQEPSAFKTGHYALGNLLYYPAPNVMVGGELQWGKRDNHSDGFSSDDVRIQFSFRYNFSYGLGGQ